MRLKALSPGQAAAIGNDDVTAGFDGVANIGIKNSVDFP